MDPSHVVLGQCERLAVSPEGRSLFSSIKSVSNGMSKSSSNVLSLRDKVGAGNRNRDDSNKDIQFATAMPVPVCTASDTARLKKRSAFEVMDLFGSTADEISLAVSDYNKENSVAVEMSNQGYFRQLPECEFQANKTDKQVIRRPSRAPLNTFVDSNTLRDSLLPEPERKAPEITDSRYRRAQVAVKKFKVNMEDCCSSRNSECIEDLSICPAEESPDVDTSRILREDEENELLSAPSTASLYHQRGALKQAFRPPLRSGPILVPLNTSVRKLAGLGSLSFPAGADVLHGGVRLRETEIPETFPNIAVYKETLIAAVVEFLNILLYDFSKLFHLTLCKASFSFDDGTMPNEQADPDCPSCKHGVAALKAVRKEGKNKGRLFYSCPVTGPDRCGLFKWQDEIHGCPEAFSGAKRKPVVSGSKAIQSFFTAHGIHFYFPAKLTSKSAFQSNRFGSAKLQIGSDALKGRLYLALPCKGPSSLYNKLDLWVISKYPHFPKMDTFIAKSEFFGPNSSFELEIQPVSSYFPSSWSKCESVYALLVGNAATEITAIENIERFFCLAEVPVAPHILNVKPSCPLLHTGAAYDERVAPRLFLPEADIHAPDENLVRGLLDETVRSFCLNPQQAQALENVASMFLPPLEECRCPITLIHGVFGAGKSYLLAIVVLFLVQLLDRLKPFTASDRKDYGVCGRKILIASTTNVAVDRVLQGLLDFGFEDFIRVGSVKKISCPILPFSVHASDNRDEELKELNELLTSDLSSTERGFVRRAIDMHKLGANRRKLADAKVVGVTCAACVFPCMEKLRFQIQLLDECSQMTEPVSLLPIARFKCEKLVLVGDPKQLSPTVQGSEAAHSRGLEFTLFERLQQAGLNPTMLLTQYRCHPSISALSSNLFYSNHLIDGIQSEERSPLFSWLPTLSILDCGDGTEEVDSSGSSFNVKEAVFASSLIKCLLSSGLNPSEIGVITQYRAQASKIKAVLADNASDYSSAELKSVRISTVDAFQGAERNVIILSCVRTRNTGFIDCPRRTNVALTRAQRHLIIVGNMKLLSGNALWKEVIRIARDKGAMIDTVSSYQKRLDGLTLHHT